LHDPDICECIRSLAQKNPAELVVLFTKRRRVFPAQAQSQSQAGTHLPGVLPENSIVADADILRKFRNVARLGIEGRSVLAVRSIVGEAPQVGEVVAGMSAPGIRVV